MILKKRLTGRKRRHIRLRRKVIGTPERPRLNVYRSLKNTYIQLVDDVNNKVLFSISTLSKELKATCKYGGNIKAANVLADIAAKKIKEKGIDKVVFDRGGFMFHGRVKVLADNLRKQGLNF